MFTLDKLADPPSCLLTVHAKPGQDTVDMLNYDVPLIGTDGEVEEICIIRNLQSEDINSSVLNYLHVI